MSRCKCTGGVWRVGLGWWGGHQFSLKNISSFKLCCILNEDMNGLTMNKPSGHAVETSNRNKSNVTHFKQRIDVSCGNIDVDWTSMYRRFCLSLRQVNVDVIKKIVASQNWAS